MHALIRAAALAATCVPLVAPASGPADPADPAASAPRPLYRSVLPPRPAGVAEGPGDWKRANAEVARFPRGHIDLLRWEQQQPAAASGEGRVAPRAADAASAPAHRH